MRVLSTTLLLGLCIGLAPSLRANVSFDTSPQNCTGNSGGPYTCSNAGLSITATGMYATFANGGGATPTVGTLATTSVTQYSPGLGVCDPQDVGYPTCGTSPYHAIDNGGGDVDFVLLQLSVPLKYIQLVLSPFSPPAEDMDATVLTGYCSTAACLNNLASELTGKTPTAAGLANITAIAGMSNVVLNNYNLAGTAGSSTNINLNLTGLGTGVNWVLVGASTAPYYGDSSSSNAIDYFKLNGLNTPEPATFVLAGSALLGLGLLRRRKMLSSNS